MTRYYLNECNFLFSDICYQAVAALGFKINFPVSSQSILKSNKTSLILLSTILVCTTLLWTPIRNNITISSADIEKNGCNQSEVKNET